MLTPVTAHKSAPRGIRVMNTARINSLLVNGAHRPTLGVGSLNICDTIRRGSWVLGVAGSVYDFAAGAWEALPASGTPTAGQVRALAPYAAAGPLANQQYAAVPAAVFASPGVWL